MLGSPHRGSALFVLLTKAGTGFAGARQLSFDEFQGGSRFGLHEGDGPFAWKVIGRYGRNEAHREPSQVGKRPTSVGFATSARAKCAFIVAPKYLAGLTAGFNPGRHPVNGRLCRYLSESTLMAQTMSIAIFLRLTLCIAGVKRSSPASWKAYFWNKLRLIPISAPA
jgi:hypothetical protein